MVRIHSKITTQRIIKRQEVKTVKEISMHLSQALLDTGIYSHDLHPYEE